MTESVYDKEERRKGKRGGGREREKGRECKREGVREEGCEGRRVRGIVRGRKGG